MHNSACSYSDSTRLRRQRGPQFPPSTEPFQGLVIDHFSSEELVCNPLKQIRCLILKPRRTAKRQSHAPFLKNWHELTLYIIFSWCEAFPGNQCFLLNAGELWWSQRNHVFFQCFCFFSCVQVGFKYLLILCVGRMCFLLRSGGWNWVWCSCFLISVLLYVQNSAREILLQCRLMTAVRLCLVAARCAWYFRHYVFKLEAKSSKQLLLNCCSNTGCC